MTKALITGINGQDGQFLAHQLHHRGADIIGASRDATLAPGLDFVTPALATDISDYDATKRLLHAFKPDEIYHLAAQSSVGASWHIPVETGLSNGMGSASLLESARLTCPHAHIFIASSAEVFGIPASEPQSESTPIQPTSPYGAAKAYAHFLARQYRDHHNMHVSIGTLYNHESHLRTSQFVTMKIIRGAESIARGESDSLSLGNLDTTRDWSYAGDVVDAIIRITRSHTPGEYVIGSGIPRTIRDWCVSIFSHFDLDYRNLVTVDPEFWQEVPPVRPIADISHIRETLGWQPTTCFDDLVRSMLEHRPVTPDWGPGQ